MPLLREEFLVLGHDAGQAVHLEVMELLGERGFLHERRKLSVEAFRRDRPLGTMVVEAAPGAVIVGVAGTEAVPLVLRGHEEAAFVAADEAGIGKLMRLAPRFPRPPEELLHALELG